MKNKNFKAGRVSNQEATATVAPSHPDYPEVEKLIGGFKIKVKADKVDDDGKVIGETVLYSRGYKDNDDNAQDFNSAEEPFDYFKVPSLESALKMEGAKLSDDQSQFLGEALKGSKETGEAVKAIVEIYNDFLKAGAQRRQYASVLNEKTPMTDENRDNAMARSVRSFVQMAGISPEIAIAQLKTLNPSPITADYTLARFLANKSKR